MRNKKCCASKSARFLRRGHHGRWSFSSHFLRRLVLTTGRLVLTTVFLISQFLISCDGEEKYSRKFPCSFVFQAQYHTASLLTRSLGNPGMFVIVSATQRQGVTHLLVNAADGQSEDIAMSTAIENERTYYENMGANRSLIIGLSNFDGLKAYDRQCPNCMEETDGTNHPLSFTNNGQAVSCGRCKRIYNLNAEGMPQNGQQGDIALLQYVVAYDGTRLYVHN